MQANQLARRTDPDTSHIAAASAQAFAADHFTAIVQALKTHGPMGKDGIGRAAGLTGVEVARRVAQMHRDGLIEPTGRYVLSNKGNPERELRAVDRREA